MMIPSVMYWCPLWDSNPHAFAPRFERGLSTGSTQADVMELGMGLEPTTN